MRKRVISFTLAIVFAFGIVPYTAYAYHPIRVAALSQLAGETRYYLTFPDVQPMIINDRVFVPLGGLQGISVVGSVEWNADTSTVLFNVLGDHASHYYVLTPGSNVVQGSVQLLIGDTDGYERLPDITVAVAPQIVDSRTMVPLRLLEDLGFGVTWEANTRTVLITY